MPDLEGILSYISEARRPEHVHPLLERVAAEYGMKTVAYLGAGTLTRGGPTREPYIAVTYSADWVNRYRAQGYLRIDPTIQVGLRRILPLDWDEFRERHGHLRQFFGESHEFGLGRQGLSFPVHGYLGDRALFSVTADFSNREWQWTRRTVLRHFPVIASHLHEAVLRTEGVLRGRPHLSRREVECLQWTSEGKTVWECGVILGLSAHTVRCYLESARYKLGASSNTHAVSLALKSGLLFDMP
ncbi:LuxR family transcriptional regulator [Mesorhizobium sp. 8]|nr:LuxR family transcriptional regulator [Mesorhizobium sp. 8]